MRSSTAAGCTFRTVACSYSGLTVNKYRCASAGASVASAVGTSTVAHITQPPRTEPVYKNITAFLIPIIQPILDLLLMLLNSVIMPILEPLLSIASSVLEPMMPLLQTITPLLELVGVIFENFSPILTEIVPALEFLAQGFEILSMVLTPIIDALSKVVGWVADGLSWLIEAFFGGDTHAAEQSTANVATYAQGGWAYEPSIFGEAGPEVAISFDPAYRKQNIGYWQEAGQLLGVYDGNSGGETAGDIVNYFSGAPIQESGGGEGITIIFSPQFTFNGNASEDDVYNVVEEAYQRFKSFMERYARENRRIRFEV